jgi:hypothetical protein
VKEPTIARHAGGGQGFSNTWKRVRDAVIDYERFGVIHLAECEVDKLDVEFVSLHYLRNKERISSVYLLCRNEPPNRSLDYLNTLKTKDVAFVMRRATTWTKFEQLATAANSTASSSLILSAKLPEDTELERLKNLHLSKPYAIVGIQHIDSETASIYGINAISLNGMLVRRTLAAGFIEKMHLFPDEREVDIAFNAFVKAKTKFFQGMVALYPD